MHLNFSGTPEEVGLDLRELDPRFCFVRVSLTRGLGAKLRNTGRVSL